MIFPLHLFCGGLFAGFAGLHARSVKAGIEGIEILGIQLLLDTSECFPETLEMHDFSCSQEANGICNLRNILDHSKDVVIGTSGFLLSSQVFEKVGDGIPFALEFAGI